MSKIVLFVCVHNSGRSQMAEAFFNHLAGGRNHAISAGPQPVGQINPVVVEVMQEVGLDVSKNKPKLLTVEMVEKADRMITMGCGAEAGSLCLAGFIETEDWAPEDLEGKTIEKVRNIRDQIKAMVNELTDEFKEYQ